MLKGSNHFPIKHNNQSKLLRHVIEYYMAEGKTLKELVDRIGHEGIDADMVGKYKRGEKGIPPRHLNSIASGLGIDKNVLFDVLVMDYAESLEEAINNLEK